MKEVNKLQLHQFYTVDVDKTLNKFLSALHGLFWNITCCWVELGYEGII